LYANMWNVELISNTFNPLYANMWNVELISNTFNTLYANMWNVELISNTFNPLYANMWNVELNFQYIQSVVREHVECWTIAYIKCEPSDSMC